MLNFYLSCPNIWYSHNHKCHFYFYQHIYAKDIQNSDLSCTFFFEILKYKYYLHADLYYFSFTDCQKWLRHSLQTESKEILNRLVFVLDILNRVWTLLKILNIDLKFLTDSEHSEHWLNRVWTLLNILKIVNRFWTFWTLTEQILNIEWKFWTDSEHFK